MNALAIRKRRGWVRAFFVAKMLGVLLLGWSTLVEPRLLKVRTLSVGQGPDATRFVLLADIHAGGWVMTEAKVKSVVAAVNAQTPDYVLMPGDFVDGHAPEGKRDAMALAGIDASVAALSQLDAPGFATLGNHDSWFGQNAVRNRLQSAGVTVLRNEGTRLGTLCVVGMADHDTDRPTAEGYRACADTNLVVALMHSPDSRELLRSDTALAVAGHTHGGQINLPLLGRAVTATECGKPCAYGMIQQAPPLYVTSGLGTSILPIRFRSPPEIVVITVRYD